MRRLCVHNKDLKRICPDFKLKLTFPSSPSKFITFITVDENDYRTRIHVYVENKKKNKQKACHGINKWSQG